MDRIKQYLGKQGITESRINEAPVAGLGLIVVIPAYKEPNIITTLSSLLRCSLPLCEVEIIVLINGSEMDSQASQRANELCLQQCYDFQLGSCSSSVRLHILQELNMPSKKGGVGLARKILMDEASSRLSQVGNPNGIIVNLDADCTVAENYLVEIVRFFAQKTDLKAASINYEHIVEHDSIVKYELHLRYFIGMQRWLGLPFAFQTVGSAMAVKANAYAAVGGMNTRKAGEDFYFLHKFIKNKVCGNLNATTVFPSGRVSDRVPFGTGKAVGDMIANGGFTTYNPESFLILQPLILGLEQIYRENYPELDDRLRQYLETINFRTKVVEIRKNTRDVASFTKRFYQFFDAFILMKYLHFVRDLNLPDVELELALPAYFERIEETFLGVSEKSLAVLRSYDKSVSNYF